ncbi:tRNA pseudouridine synthase B [Lampropedia cohaerens]|uniref:tRNA pseudouridine synthase B n=1 Tax=Lampropedia cohaerens TaxID=1610491 RepID=A0A0U1PXX0_9BURK|nr:tRNA pseudouridine(55) synthase TruB [Lampropedia cohaerens]KKW67373.1 tRNA pseudouridine synthase B [Lampropedia cohaerens]
MTAPARVRVQRRPVHGVLLLDKPLGISSNQALQKAKWLLRAEKAGHTGTLDPLASGILPLCFGAATKFSQLQLEADKTYETIVRLGVNTTTADAEGEVVQQRPVQCSVGQVVQVLDDFMGTIAQLPPMHSALKKDGKALYEYAREGETVEREVRRVQIHALELLSMQLEGDAPHLHLRVVCSKGTYIRTLGEDIGNALGCGGHLAMLRRVATGGLNVADAVSLEQLEAMPEEQRLQLVQPVETLLQAFPQLVLPPDDAGRFLSGVRRRGAWADTKAVAVFGDQPRALLGMGHVQAGELIPDRLLSVPEIQQILQQQAIAPYAGAAVARLSRAAD